jgi:hypothetical protein
VAIPQNPENGLCANTGVLKKFVFDNQKWRQKIMKNSVTPINTEKDDRPKRRHLCIKNSVTRD